MKHNFQLENLAVSELRIEKVTVAVEYEAQEIKDMLTHPLPFVTTTIKQITQEVLPLVREMKREDREYYEQRDAEHSRVEHERQVELEKLRHEEAERQRQHDLKMAGL